MNSKKNVSLIVGIAIPILMIVLVAISIYVPALFAPAPRINFLYVTGDDYYQGPQYFVENGTLAKREVKYPNHYTPGIARFFLHDVSANEDKELSFEETQKLKLDASAKSTDGYEVVYGNTEGGVFPLFFSNRTDYNAMYLKGHNTSKKLNLQSSDVSNPYYSRNRRFLGWIR